MKDFIEVDLIKVYVYIINQVQIDVELPLEEVIQVMQKVDLYGVALQDPRMEVQI